MSGDAADELPRLRTAVRMGCEACRAGFAGIDLIRAIRQCPAYDCPLRPVRPYQRRDDE